MKNNISFLALGLIFIFISSNCNTAKKISSKSSQQSFITQDGTEFPLEAPMTLIKLKQKSFAIHFFSKAFQESADIFHATQIASFVEKDDLDLIYDQINVEEVPYLSPGTGLAAPQGKEYDSMYLTNSGHHYILYEPNGNKRAQLVKTYADGILELKWEINRFYHNDSFLSFEDLTWKSIYLVLFYDKNHNEIVDKGEYYRVALEFE